ncbi:MAG: hypothetical protein NZ570_00210 [Candidatus Caldarchaeum sp.]|nr:hypothetical protein [Candidatus Caldarchaeum sp.]MDW7978022.1 hypothetical protein [Candidatus Caldarchaeum sp.]
MESSGEKPLPRLSASVKVVNPKIYQATKHVEPRVSNLVIVAIDENGSPIEGCHVSYDCKFGVIDPHSYKTTDGNGLALASYYSHRTGKEAIKIKVEKEGFTPAEALAEVEVVETATLLKITNAPNKGEIFINGQKVGEGKAELVVTTPGIYVVSWGNLDGYEPPSPMKLYINPNFSVEPMSVEGKYVPIEEKREYVEVSVFVCITFDDASGIPNPVPDAPVFLSDGQSGVADKSGLAKFRVKANSGPLKIRAKHPNLYEYYQEAEVNIGTKDVHVNLDFGIFFGGEAVVGLEL